MDAWPVLLAVVLVLGTLVGSFVFVIYRDWRRG